MLTQIRDTWLDRTILSTHLVIFPDHFPIVLELNRIIPDSDFLKHGMPFWMPPDPSMTGFKPKREPSGSSPEDLVALATLFARDVDRGDVCEFPRSDLVAT